MSMYCALYVYRNCQYIKKPIYLIQTKNSYLMFSTSIVFQCGKIRQIRCLIDNDNVTFGPSAVTIIA